MVQRLESCHIRDIDGDHRPGSCRSGSLPIALQAINTNPNQQSQFPSLSFSPSGPDNASSQFLPFAPFMSTSWWLDPNMQLQDNSIIQDGWIPMQPEDTVAKKDKHDGDPEQPRSHPIQRSQAKQLSPELSNFSGLNGMDMLPLDIFSNPMDSTFAIPPTIPSTATSLQNFSWNPSSNINRVQDVRRCPPPTSVPRKLSVAEQLRPSHYSSQQNPNLMRANQTSNAQEQTVTIPAVLAPDQSVSPRTQTVEVPNLPSSSQPQARQVLSQHAMAPSGVFQPSSQQLRTMMPMYLTNRFQIPRSAPSWSDNRPLAKIPQQNPGLNRPQQSDIMRKPSLYKVPPWPSPASFSTTAQPSSAAAQPQILKTINHENSSTSRLPSTCSSNNSLPSNSMTCQSTITPNSQKNFPPQRAMPIMAARTPPPPFPPGSPSIPLQLQQNPNKRKHSPNL